MSIFDWLGLRFKPKGAVVEIGVPMQERTERVPLTLELVQRHLQAVTALPATLAEPVYRLLANPLSMQHSGSELVKQLPAEILEGVDKAALGSLINVLINEVTRRMYIESAGLRPGVVGIRLLAEQDPPPPEIAAITEVDAHGLGKGVYPLNAVPDNPTPGKRCGFYVRVVQKV